MSDYVYIPRRENESVGWRSPTHYERHVFEKLLSCNFAGATQLRQQLDNCVVRTMDGQGSIAIRTTVTAPADVTSRVPVEAVADDADGHGIHYLLHVIHGIAVELEVFTDTTLDIIALPSPGSLRVQVNQSSTSTNEAASPSRRSSES